MIITSIILLFNLLISLIACISPLNGWLDCLAASQVVCDANRLTGFSVMEIFVEGSSRAVFCWLERHVFLKMPVNLIQYRGTVGSFNSQHFAFVLKHKVQSLLIHSYSHAFSYYVCFFCSSVLFFLFLLVF